MKSEKAKLKFTELLGKDVVKKISEKNQVEFEKKAEVYNLNEILMNFKDYNEDGNEETYCQICYTLDTNKWYSINGIDYPHKVYDTYEEMKNHLVFLENRIKSKGIKTTVLS